MLLTKKRYPVWLVMLFLLLYVGFFGAGDRSDNFACQAQLTHGDRAEGFSDFFITSTGRGRGYLMFTGARGCDEDKTLPGRDIIDFTYRKEGNGYDLRLQKQRKSILSLFPQLTEDPVNMKLEKLDRSRYLLSANSNVLIVCRANSL